MNLASDYQNLSEQDIQKMESTKQSELTGLESKGKN